MSIKLRSNAKDHTSERFGKLTVLEPVAKGKNGDVLWLAECECGGTIIDRYFNLRKYTGCGCDQAKSGERSFKHGGAIGPNRTYNTWIAMRKRCANPASEKWEYYGELGVKVCRRWQDFSNFLSDMGQRPDGMTIDRIDPYGDYEPSNCRWADAKTQRHNRRDC